MPKKKGLDDVKSTFMEIWGELYDYSLINESNYKNMSTKVPIVCKQHGIFYKTPNKHIKRKQGCPICGISKRVESARNKPRLMLRTKKFGIGFNDYEGCVFKGKDDIQSYRIWNEMMVRCYDKNYHSSCPTYIGCSVCDEWLKFSNFKRWFDKHYTEGYCLDKDILIKGNKVYSPQTCCFVPNEINALLNKHKGKRGKYPIGVGKHGNKFSARLNMYSKNIWIGSFNTAEEAFIAYKNEKEKYLHEIADKYYKNGKISKEVHDALCRYQVDIND